MKKDRLVIVNKLKDFSGCLKPVQTGFNRFGTFKTGRKSFLTCFKLLSNFGKVIICFRPILHFLKTIFDVSHGGREGGSPGRGGAATAPEFVKYATPYYDNDGAITMWGYTSLLLIKEQKQ